MKKNITTAIKNLLANDKFFSTISPEEINRGLCDEFAFEIEQCIKGAEAVWADMWIECTLPDCADIFKGLSLSHCFIEYEDKYYDSECPQGVNHPIQLPFFEKQNA